MPPPWATRWEPWPTTTRSSAGRRAARRRWRSRSTSTAWSASRRTRSGTTSTTRPSTGPRPTTRATTPPRAAHLPAGRGAGGRTHHAVAAHDGHRARLLRRAAPARLRAVPPPPVAAAGAARDARPLRADGPPHDRLPGAAALRAGAAAEELARGGGAGPRHGADRRRPREPGGALREGPRPGRARGGVRGEGKVPRAPPHVRGAKRSGGPASSTWTPG